jgi:HPt (histidine-containing phosphotransfer) domain-containing protein
MSDEVETPVRAPAPSVWLDAEEAIRQLRGGAEGYVEMCRIFLQEAQHWEAQLREAQLRGLPAPDREGFIAVLHEVTNALPIVGAKVAGQSLRQMEYALREDDRLPVEPTLQAVLDTIVGVSEALKLQISQLRA